MGNPTPLYVAAYQGHIDCAKELIQAGADLNIVDGKGNTHFIAAAQNFSLDYVSTLLKAGAEVDATHLAHIAAPFLRSQNSEGTDIQYDNNYSNSNHIYHLLQVSLKYRFEFFYHVL